MCSQISIYDCVKVLSLFAYLQISMGSHKGVCTAVMKDSWLATRNHSEKLSVDLLLLLTDGLIKDEEKNDIKNKKN